MKILIISHEFPPVGGGGANACMNLAHEYAKKGNPTDIVTVWYEGEKDVEEAENLIIYRVKSKRKNKEYCNFSEMLDFILKAKKRSDFLVRKNSYDICQVFFGIPSGLVGLYLKKRYGIPYVVRFGGGDIPGFQDRYSIIYKMIGPAIKLIWKNADALVANSSGLRNMAEEFYDKRKISIICNGAEVLESDIDKEESDTIRLLFVSRLIERKGLQDIIPQMGEVREELKKNGRKIELHIVGDGPYRETLERLTYESAIEDLVFFHGYKNRNELAWYYQNADIFIFPSRKEGMPNVVLEAMSYGLPVIMTPCQGSEELIGGNGICKKVEDFGKSIIDMSLNRQLRLALGRKSLDMIKEKYNWEVVSTEYLNVFKNIIYC